MFCLSRKVDSVLGVVALAFLLASDVLVGALTIQNPRAVAATGRERININTAWKFSRFTSNPDSLSYTTLKQWVMPSANDFVKGAKSQSPSGTPPGASVQYVQASFDDKQWETVNLPHDWAIKGSLDS